MNFLPNHHTRAPFCAHYAYAREEFRPFRPTKTAQFAIQKPPKSGTTTSPKINFSTYSVNFDFRVLNCEFNFRIFAKIIDIEITEDEFF